MDPGECEKEPFDDSFPDDNLFAVTSLQAPWFADFVNYISCGVLPPELSYQQRKKFLSDVKHYYWDEPCLYKRCADEVFRRCLPEEEVLDVISHCHSSPYGGHASTTKTAAKILQSGFYWLSLFKDVRHFVLSCDRCQRTRNISRRNEMPLNNIF